VRNAITVSVKKRFPFQDFLSQGGLLLIILIAQIAIFGFISPYFFSPSNMLSILLQSSMIGCLALGATLIIISGGIDLSSGALLAVATIVAAKTQMYGVFVSCSLAILMCICLGAVNGLLVAKGKIPPFITTLGMMGIAKGIALVISDGQVISGITMPFHAIASGSLLGIPNPALIFILLAIATWIFLKKTKWGYELFAVGGNNKTAKLSGINVDSVLMMVYILGGLFAAIGGIIYASRLTVGQASAGDGYELFAIVAAVLGGASLNGGIGNIFGTVISVIILGVLSNFLNLTGISPFIQDAIQGLLILGAVYYNLRQSRK
jgi:ribose/xylose/arabinose/galactoside ABC-type transport system permease subunit